ALPICSANDICAPAALRDRGQIYRSRNFKISGLRQRGLLSAKTVAHQLRCEDRKGSAPATQEPTPKPTRPPLTPRLKARPTAPDPVDASEYRSAPAARCEWKASPATARHHRQSAGAGSGG